MPWRGLGQGSTLLVRVASHSHDFFMRGHHHHHHHRRQYPAVLTAVKTGSIAHLSPQHTWILLTHNAVNSQQ